MAIMSSYPGILDEDETKRLKKLEDDYYPNWLYHRDHIDIAETYTPEVEAYALLTQILNGLAMALDCKKSSYYRPKDESFIKSLEEDAKNKLKELDICLKKIES